jgi:hypothetical protein
MVQTTDAYWFESFPRYISGTRLSSECFRQIALNYGRSATYSYARLRLRGQRFWHGHRPMTGLGTGGHQPRLSAMAATRRVGRSGSLERKTRPADCPGRFLPLRQRRAARSRRSGRVRPVDARYRLWRHVVSQRSSGLVPVPQWALGQFLCWDGVTGERELHLTESLASLKIAEFQFQRDLA